MVRLSILFASLSMVFALGVSNSAEAKRLDNRVKLRKTICPKIKSGQRGFLIHGSKIETPGFKGSQLRVDKPITTFIGARIDRNGHLSCRYTVKKDNGSMVAVIMAGSGPSITDKYKCTPGSGFSVSSKGAVCTKKKKHRGLNYFRPRECIAICKRKAG